MKYIIDDAMGRAEAESRLKPSSMIQSDEELVSVLEELTTVIRVIGCGGGGSNTIDRLAECLPPDWGEGYENVIIGCTVENQDRADARLPLFLELPIRHRTIIAAPLLTALDLREYLDPEKIEELAASGESGREARPCHYEWILSLREQCVEKGIPFQFHQTGANFVKDGRVFRIPRREQTAQARKAGIDYKIEDRIRPLVIPSGVAGSRVEQMSFFEEGSEDAEGR